MKKLSYLIIVGLVVSKAQRQAHVELGYRIKIKHEPNATQFHGLFGTWNPTQWHSFSDWTLKKATVNLGQILTFKHLFREHAYLVQFCFTIPKMSLISNYDN